MKVIVEGQKPRNPWEGTWSCPVCNMVIELDANDGGLVKQQYPHAASPFFARLMAIRMECPCCGEDVTFSRWEKPEQNKIERIPYVQSVPYPWNPSYPTITRTSNTSNGDDFDFEIRPMKPETDGVTV